MPHKVLAIKPYVFIREKKLKWFYMVVFYYINYNYIK